MSHTATCDQVLGPHHHEEREHERRGGPLSELLAEFDGEDLDRVVQAITTVKRRRVTAQEWPADLWIRAAEPDRR